MEADEEDVREKLEILILELCKSGSPRLEDSKLKQIKSFCKSSDINVRAAFEVLVSQLRKDHSEIRFSAFQIIDSLFQRSHLFRELILEQFQGIFELVLETNPHHSLPAPRKTANELKKLSAKSIKEWHDKFGSNYKLLDLGFIMRFIEKKVDFVSFSHQSNAQRVHSERANEKQKIFQNKKYIEYVKEMTDKEIDIKNCVEQLDRCIGILMPKDDLFNKEDFEREKIDHVKPHEPMDDEGSDSDGSEDDFVEVPAKKSKEEADEEQSVEMRYLGFENGTRATSIDDLKNTKISIDLFIKENDENKIVIDIMRDLYKELKHSHLFKINNWIKNFGQIRDSSNNLKKAIELKNSVQEILKNFDNLNIPPMAQSQKSDLNLNLNLNKPGTSKSKISNQKEMEPSLNRDQIKKKEMLKIAPVINLNEMEYLAPIVQIVETSHPLFQRRDNDIENGYMENAPRLTKKTFTGNFEPVKWSCRAPLKNGRLCPRMDRFKCPMHGKIVARDEQGEIVDEKDKLEFERTRKSVVLREDAELIADINAAIGVDITPLGSDRGKKKSQKRKNGNLTNVGKEENTTRSRLERRLLDYKSLNKIGTILDSIERKHNHEKFHHNYNYSIQS